ncbi:MAG: peptidyl-alpha-hydroxyglycine alpha-amidating lyase family protein, partial [Terriglobia bacterium]
MRRLGLILLVFMLAPLVSFAQSPPEISYSVVPDFLKMPVNLYLGEVPGVAVDKAGDIYVYTRSGHTRLFEFAPDGKYTRELGHDLYSFVFAHAVRIGPEGNIWAVDEASNMIVELNPDGRVLMNLGRRPEPSEKAAAPGTKPEFTPPPWMFNRETDIAWDSHG